jgi:hypothetical protein
MRSAGPTELANGAVAIEEDLTERDSRSGDLDLTGGNPEQRLTVDDEPGHAADATRSQMTLRAS